MQHLRTESVPAHETEVVDHLTCDLCGERIAAFTGHHVDEVDMRHHVGDNYPEGGWGEDEEFDICPTCWRDVLVPWLRQRGAQPRVKSWDW